MAAVFSGERYTKNAAALLFLNLFANTFIRAGSQSRCLLWKTDVAKRISRGTMPLFLKFHFEFEVVWSLSPKGHPSHPGRCRRQGVWDICSTNQSCFGLQQSSEAPAMTRRALIRHYSFDSSFEIIESTGIGSYWDSLRGMTLIWSSLISFSFSVYLYSLIPFSNLSLK